MAISLAKSELEIQQLPLVELAWEILKVKKEPAYFRDLMDEIKSLRNLTDEEVTEVIARLYTEINVDGRFVCIGQNIWGLKRWFPVDKAGDRTVSSKKFVRASGDAFSDDDEDMDDYDELEDAEVEDEGPLFTVNDEGEPEEVEDDDEEELTPDDEDAEVDEDDEEYEEDLDEEGFSDEDAEDDDIGDEDDSE